MSSTNVHSERSSNIQIVGGQTIPTEKDIEIPPKSIGKGPSTLDVVLGESMEISVGESELHKDGKLVAKDGTLIAQFDKNAFNRIAAKYNKTNKRATTRRSIDSANKGDDR